MNKNYLKPRWESDIKFKTLFNIVLQVLDNGGDLSAVGNFAEHIGGKMDLRGIVVNRLKIQLAQINKVDFSSASFVNTWIEKSFFADCVFNTVDFSGLSDHNNTFQNCTFNGCKFKNAVIGCSGSKFENCTFLNCNFSKTIFVRPEFTDASFLNNKIENIDFNASYFENCVFEGKLKNVWFRGGFPLKSDIEHFGIPRKNKMKFVSFANAVLSGLTFSEDCDLSTVSINESGAYMKFDKWKSRLENLISQSHHLAEPIQKELALFASAHLNFATNQDWYILNRDEILNDFGEEIGSTILRTLLS